MKKSFGIIILVVVLFTILLAQSDFEAWKQQQQQQMRQFKNKQDKQFSQFLEQNWKAFKVFSGEKEDDTPKPVKVPEVKMKDPKEFPQKNIVKEIPLPPPPQVQEIQKVEALPAVQAAKDVQLSFFQKKLILKYNQELKLQLAKPIKDKKIAEFWQKLGKKEFEPVQKQLLYFKNEMELNDWGYALLLHKAGELLYEDKNLATLFTWFMLTQSGYICKIGYNDATVKLLLASDQVFYGKPYLKLEEQRYYAVSFDNQSTKQANLYTYEGNHADAQKVMDLFLQTAPTFSAELKERTVKFEYKGQKHELKLSYNPQNIEYYDVYPNTNLSIYFESPMKKEVEYELLKQLEKIINGKSQAEAANILLRFVQTGFQYKTDAQQFGREKAFFPEETLYYPYCDCEDRSVLFSYLVRKLLNLEVLGLDYPGHVATAVLFHEEIAGDAVSYDGKRYVICDPTYINADLGMAMPEFKDKKPQIIQTK
jgi:hypothetical protein